MATRKVPVERHVTQVCDGIHYKGHVMIAGTRLEYEFVFGVHIDQLDQTESSDDREELRRLFQITVKRDGVEIELTHEEFVFFFSILAEFVVRFYNDQQTRGLQEGEMGSLLRGTGPLADADFSASIGMTSNGTYDFSPEVCVMLSAPKFNCTFAA